MPGRSQPPAPVRVAPPEIADLRSAMTPRFNLFFRWFARRFFGHFDLDEATVAELRELESRGAVVYVMRYASRLDYFLFNTLFLREGLRLSGFANGVSFYYYRPLFDALRIRLGRLRRPRPVTQGCERALALAGQSSFLFLRTARMGSWLGGRERALEAGKQELDRLDELVGAVWDAGCPVYLVPLALFWRKGPRAERRFLNLTYGASTRPSDLTKVASFLTTYRGLSVKVGEAIDLRAFVEERRHEGRESLVRKVRRSLLIFLYREEKVVEGPTLRPRYKVQDMVLGDPQVRAAIEAHSVLQGVPLEAARAEAERIFREIAANMNSTFLAGLNLAVSFVFRRLFASIEVNGLEKVTEYAKRHPIVLLPSHRSYFDFLILSWLFYGNHLVPPHIAARENMGFGPFGMIFRRAGAFFLRRSFDAPLYKDVFRRYVAYLVKEGFTQEFFIEGGRSRTGKTLPPRLGMLSWDVEAFLAGARRDLFLVPVAISYERLVEESAMVHELEGGRKVEESTLGLLRARKVLRRRFGSVFVNFGEPISLADALGPRRVALAAPTSREVEEEKRRFIELLSERIVERINWATVANATSVAACALLGERRRGLFRHELTAHMREIVELLRLQDVKLSPALARDKGDFREAIAFLLRSDLIHAAQDARGEILYFEESRRRALDFYRNGILHFIAVPSLLARRLLRGASAHELREDLSFWLELFHRELFLPLGEVMAAHLDAFVDHFERTGWLERDEERMVATDKGRPGFRFLAEQTRTLLEAYYAVTGAVLASEGVVAAPQLEHAAGEQFERCALVGEVVRPESANPVTLANSLDVLARRGILERASGQGRERLYARGPGFDECRRLRERLAAALADR